MLLTWLIRIHNLAAEKLARDDGVTSVEYGLMVALIAIVIISGVTLLGSKLAAMFNNIAATLP